MPNISDVNPQISSVIPAPPKKLPVKIIQNKVTGQPSPNNIKEIVQRKITGRKVTRTTRNEVREKVGCRKSARIPTKVQSNDNSQKSVQTKKTRIKKTIPKKSLTISRRVEGRALEDDTVDSQDNSNVIINIPKYNTRRKWDYKLDPTTNTITFEGVKFTILSDPEEKVRCKLCNVILRYNRGSMRFHIIKRHTNLCACTQCSFKGDKKNALETHIQAVHNGIRNRKKVPCKICGKLENTGISHEWTHMNKKEREEILRKKPDWLRKSMTRNWECDKCDKVFTKNGSLTRHKEKHHGAKCNLEGTCPTCGKTVKNLRDHMRNQHGGPKNLSVWNKVVEKDLRYYTC